MPAPLAGKREGGIVSASEGEAAPDAATASRYTRKPEGDPEAAEEETQVQWPEAAQGRGQVLVRVRPCANEQKTEGEETLGGAWLGRFLRQP